MMNIFSSLSKWQIKIMLIIIGFVIVLSAVIYTQTVVDELIDREQKAMSFYADITKRLISRLSDPEASDDIDDLLFIINNITPTIAFPVIITDESDIPLEPFDQYTLNIEFDTVWTPDEKRAFAKEYVKKMGASYDPIIVEDNDGKILNKFYYTNSQLVDFLQLFPFFEIIIVSIFIVIGYLAFSNIRRSEESKVWVGMAKEAAHQLGTPLSSLLAWIEIMKNSKEDPESIENVISEVENDVSRLSIIATRFSKIGSLPELNVTELNGQIEKVCAYFEKRLPHIGRTIDIVRQMPQKIDAQINQELFAWVLENLIKNAAEAIEGKKGSVAIKLSEKNEDTILITVTDSGKGMSSKQKRQVFHPGFTTKKRGWGLGLSLCKRIVEEYHKGKIYIKETTPGKGTVFAIELPKLSRS